MSLRKYLVFTHNSKSGGYGFEVVAAAHAEAAKRQAVGAKAVAAWLVSESKAQRLTSEPGPARVPSLREVL